MTGCPLDSKSLGDDEGASDDSGDDESSGDDTGDEPPAPAVERWGRIEEGITPRGIAVAADGTAYVVGNSAYSIDQDDAVQYGSAWLGRVDPDGEIAWSIEDGMEGRSAGAIATTSDGFVVATSYRYSDATPAEVVRYDAEGNEGWSVALDFDADEIWGQQPDAIAVGPGELVVTVGQIGYADSSTGFVVAIDGTTGTRLWEIDLIADDETQADVVSTVAFAPDGDVVVAGAQSVNYLEATGRAWLAKISPEGEIRWAQAITDDLAENEVESVGVAPDGTILALATDGESHSLRRFDVMGAETTPFELEYVTDPRHIAVASDGGFVITDGLRDDPETCETYWGPCPTALRIARADADGTVRWFDQREDCELGVAAGFAPDGNVVVAGACPPDETKPDVVELGVFGYAP